MIIFYISSCFTKTHPRTYCHNFLKTLYNLRRVRSFGEVCPIRPEVVVQDTSTKTDSLYPRYLTKTYS